MSNENLVGPAGPDTRGWFASMVAKRSAARRRKDAAAGEARAAKEMLHGFLMSLPITVGGHRPATRFRHLGWCRPGSRPAALLCGIRSASGRRPRATRTVSGAVHRPCCHSRRALDVRAFARSGGDDIRLPRWNAGGTVSAAETVLNGRALNPW